MKLSLIIEAFDRASRPLDRVNQSVNRLDRSTKLAAGGIAKADGAMLKAERSAESLAVKAERMGFAIGSGARRGISGLVALERRMTITREGMGRLAGLAGSLVGGGLAVGATIITAGLVAGLYKVASAGMIFEKYRTQLTGLEGSVAAGEKAMGWVTDFARTTPYEIGEVMEAFIRLKAYGLDPTNGTLRILGDTAGGMGKSLSQAVEMIADAGTGEFERLKEFGIKASQKGDVATFNFVRNGKQMTRTAKKTAADIDRVLFEIFSERFAGGMDRLAATTEGKWSNVMDRLTISAKRVWEGGLGASVNKQLDRFSSWIDGMEKNGSLKSWAEKVGKGLGDIVSDIGAVDWPRVGGDIKEVASAISELADAIGSVGSAAASGLNATQRFLNSAGEAMSWLNPIGLANNFLGAVPKAGARARAVPSAAPARRLPPSPQTIDRFRRSLDAPQGHVKLEISAPGMAVRPTKIAATGMDLSVNTGRTMGAFA